jgi:hypothetical protein
MRRASRILCIAAVAAGAIAATAAPGGAGVPVPPSNTLTVVKHVVGSVPAGTTFTVEVNCVSGIGPAAPVIPTVTFDATGAPLTSAVFSPGPTSTCTVTETVNGGASSVGYACDIVRGSSDQIGPPFLGSCTADNAVSFNDVINDSATITVTNTFPTPAPPAPPAPPVAGAVQIAPAFTG